MAAFGTFLKKAAGFAVKKAAGPAGALYSLFAPSALANDSAIMGKDKVDWNTSPTSTKNMAPGTYPGPQPATGGGGIDYGGGGFSGGGGSTGGGGAALPAYDPNTDPTRVQSARGEVQSRIDAANAVIGALFGQVDSLAANKATELNANYDQQGQALEKSYTTQTGQLQNIYSARNTANSSYYDNAQGEAAESFRSGQNQLATGRQNNLAEIGRFAATTKAGFEGSRPRVNLNDITTVEDALNLRNNLDQLIGNLSSQQAGLQTNSQYAQQVKGIAPVQQTGSNQLAAQLQKLTQSSAPNFAKAEIAKGYIKAAQLGGPEAEDYWLNYFNQMLTPTTAEPVVDPTKAV